jgi:hypothetical protein
MLLPERHTHFFEQGKSELVRAGRRAYTNVKAGNIRNLVAIDLGKHDLLFDAERVIAMTVEGFP